MSEYRKKKNQLYTKSYVIKRLVDNKFYVKHIIDTYPKNDQRYWTILINPNRHDILLTCVRSRDNDKVQFRINAKNDINILLETESLNVLMKVLLDLNSRYEQQSN